MPGHGPGILLSRTWPRPYIRKRSALWRSTYSIAPRIPPGRVEGQESSKADVLKEPVVVVVVVAVAVIYRCSFIAYAFSLVVDFYVTH